MKLKSYMIAGAAALMLAASCALAEGDEIIVATVN